MIGETVEFIRFVKTGLAVTMIAFVAITIGSKLAEEPPDPQIYKRCFDCLYRAVVGDVEREIGTLSTSRYRTEALLVGVMGFMVFLFAVGYQLWGMIAVTGLGLTGYELFGIIPPLDSAYRLVVYSGMLLGISLMVRASERAHFIAKYQ